MERVNLSDRETRPVADGIEATVLAGGERMNLQHFVIDPGAAVPAHVHENEQLGYLLEGTVVVSLPDGEETLRAGDSYAIPANEPHGAENPADEPAVGIDVFCPPRSVPGWEREEDD